MLQLLQPIGLLFSASMAVPIIIHLWNNRQGKVLRIGSIALLDKDRIRQSRSRRLSEWWLLILRCLLLVFISLLLAGPSWKKPGEKAGKGGWVLVDQGLPRHDSLPAVDSLLRQGYRLLRWPASSADGQPLSYWTLLEGADRMAPAGVPFQIFAGDQLRRYAGSRPSTGRSVTWHILATKDTLAEWIHAAWPFGADSLRVIRGRSGPTATAFQVQDMEQGGTGGMPLHPDTTTLKVLICTDARGGDKEQGMGAGYVAAAIHGLSNYTRRRVDIRTARPEEVHGLQQDTGNDWCFWLSTDSLPASLVAKHFFVYAPGRPEDVDSRIITPSASFPLMKRIAAGTLAGEGGMQNIWEDGFGRPVLSLSYAENIGSRSGQTVSKKYYFFSRLDPSWNGLVWNAAFPALLGDLILGSSENDPHDQRVIDQGQINTMRDTVSRPAPAIGAPGAKDALTAAADEERLDLGPLCWSLIFLLLLAERILVYWVTQKEGNA